jgi:hypothetical protein
LQISDLVAAHQNPHRPDARKGLFNHRGQENSS